MSDETARLLAEAQDHETAKRAKVLEQERALVTRIADELPEQIERLARRVTQDQAPIARELGREGISQLRAELRTRAEEIAADLRQAVEAIPWPQRRDGLVPVTSNDVRHALFEHLYGAPMNSLGAIFRRHGFDTHDSGVDRDQGLVLPQYVYDGKTLAPLMQAVADACTELAAATQATRHAKKTDDEDTVNSLWDE